MTDAALPVKDRRGRGWLILVAFVAVDFILGAAAGVYAGLSYGLTAGSGEDSAAHDAPAEAAEPHAPRQEIDVGRITVVIPADPAATGAEAGRRLHLLITPLVVAHPEGAAAGGEGGHGAEGDDAPAGPTAELRDAFIEYLSQLRAPELQGSLGLALMRTELLRRARAVAPDLNASAVLIQEFIIQ